MITYAVKEVEFVCNRTVTQTGLSLLTEKKKKKKSRSPTDQSNGIEIEICVTASLPHLRNLYVVSILQQKKNRLKMLHQPLSSVSGSLQAPLCLLN